MTTDPTEEAGAYRIEHDSMGEVRVPRDAKWRATTQRAVENFPISGQGLEPAHIAALGAIKAAAAQVNGELGILEADAGGGDPGGGRGGGGGHAGRRIPDRRVPDRLRHQQQHERQRGDRHPRDASGWDGPVHPNDDVNASQSSNDVFPSSIHLAATASLVNDLLPALEHLAAALEAQARRVRGRGEVGPHAPHGRHPGHAGPGVRRLCGPGARRHRAAPGGAATAGRAAARRHGGRHRHQHAARLRRADDRGAGRAHRPAADRGARPLRGAGRPGRGWSRHRASCEPWRSASTRSPTTCAGWAPARAPGCARSTSPTCSQARRSCRAR